MSSEENVMFLALELIRLDGGTQTREKLDKDLIDEYAERMTAGDVFPPIVVIFDGEHYWLADGFHRLRAAEKRQQPTIECRVFEGTLRDAILVAVKANATHGLRRTNADKRRAVALLLTDEEWSQKTNRWIAEVCGVSHHLVETVRRQVGTFPNWHERGDSASSQRVGQDGKTYSVARAMSSGDDPADAIDDALQNADRFDRCLLTMRKLVIAVEKLACAPGGQFLFGARLEDCRTHLREAAHHLTVTRPHERCGQCRGAGCDHCRQHGWVCAAIDGPEWRLH